MAFNSSAGLRDLLLRRAFESKTDDRGVYRLYGLPPGRYNVLIGESGAERGKPDRERVPCPVTYHPYGPDRSKATAVEVASGSEVTGIDIKVVRSPRSKTFVAAGRIIDAETGKPVPGAGFFWRKEGDDSIGNYERSDSRGEFRIDSLLPGSYTIEIHSNQDYPWYSEKFSFEISGSDVSGLEIKAYKAGSISGVVVIEGTDDPAILAKVSQLKLTTDRFYDAASVRQDGTFFIAGIAPNKRPIVLKLGPIGIPEGLSLLRVERDGVELWRGIEMKPGEQVTGVRVVVGYYTGKIRGQIRVEGGLIPEQAVFYIHALTVEDARKLRDSEGDIGPDFWLNRMKRATVDARRIFVFECMPPGEYEVTLNYYPSSPLNIDVARRGITVTRNVVVTNGSETELALTLDLSVKREEK